MWRGFTVPTCAWKIKRSTVEAREETNERKKRKEKRKKQRSEEGKEAVEPFATLSIGVVGVVAESRVTSRDSKLGRTPATRRLHNMGSRARIKRRLMNERNTLVHAPRQSINQSSQRQPIDLPASCQLRHGLFNLRLSSSAVFVFAVARCQSTAVRSLFSLRRHSPVSLLSVVVTPLLTVIFIITATAVSLSSSSQSSVFTTSNYPLHSANH